MLQILSRGAKELKRTTCSTLDNKEVIWCDLLFPTDQEIQQLEESLNIKIPSLLGMSEIEESSRLFVDKGVFYMTSLIITNGLNGEATITPITFIMLKHVFVTVRYCDPKSFQLFIKKNLKNGYDEASITFLALLDTIVAGIADVLELNFESVNRLSKEIFRAGKESEQQGKMGNILLRIGQIEDMNSKVRESLETLERQLIFCHNHIGNEESTKFKISTLQQDIKSLIDFLTFLFHKIDFLLSATLGFIDIEQSSIIKIFSIVVVIFLPATLISSIYGMNFKIIPELQWFLGYPFALALMLLSTLIAFLYFKRKKWL